MTSHPLLGWAFCYVLGAGVAIFTFRQVGTLHPPDGGYPSTAYTPPDLPSWPAPTAA